MHDRTTDLARFGVCSAHEDQDTTSDSLFDRVIFACAWLACVFVLLAVGMGVI